MVENNATLCRSNWRDRTLYMAMRRLRAQADYDDASVVLWKLEERRDAIRDFVTELTR